MIQIRGLHKRYGPKAGGAPTLNGIDAEVRAGESVAIVGPSGSGKSTLLRCINALEAFDEGALHVAGFDLTGGVPPARAAVRALRESVGMVFQDLHLFPHLTALDNITLAPRIVCKRPEAEAEGRGRDLLRRVGLADKADAYPAQLSGGQKQRVAIARAMAMPVRVLLLDEPTSALDPAMRDEVREVVRTLAREASLTVVFVTHEMRLAAELADRVWVLEAGRIVADGPPREVLK